MRAIVRALCVFVISLSAFAGGLASLTNSQATTGLRQALDQGARAAVDQLGQSGGFLNNPKVRIPLPSVLEQTRSVLKFMGKGDDLEALETTMNRAAEAAVPEARNLLVAAVKQMSVQDAKNILAGGDDSVTRYFEEKTRAALTTRFLPVVTKQTDRLALSGQYNALAGKAAGGRRLDFLVQELGREINTIGSKSAAAEISRLVVEGKAELEKIREQAQNLE